MLTAPLITPYGPGGGGAFWILGCGPSIMEIQITSQLPRADKGRERCSYLIFRKLLNPRWEMSDYEWEAIELFGVFL